MTTIDETPQPSEPETAKPAPEEEPRKSAATALVELALESYRMAVSIDGEAVAVPLVGPQTVRSLRGGRMGLRAELARAYRRSTGRVAPQQALADALLALEGEAQESDPIEINLRVAQVGDVHYLDLGDVSGRAVKITGEGWSVVDQAPVMFRRTVLTAPLPEPVRGGSLGDMWALLNLAEADRAPLAAWLVSILWPKIPHPIPALTGEQGTGKTSAARMLGGLLDPSPVPVRKAPRDADSWVTAAAGSWVVPLDNLSGISDWLSDTLCRAVTGDGDVRRQLYTDGGLVVFAFRRCVLLTGIDLGALRGDLGDRLLPLDLEVIDEKHRREESDVWGRWEQMHPRILGAVLDLAAGVAGVLPGVSLSIRPRMADFAKLLAAVDQVLGTRGFDRYTDRAAALAADALAGDPFVLALASKFGAKTFTGPAAELLAKVPQPDGRVGKEWPGTARALSGLLKRQAPVMRRAGWAVVESDDGHAKVKKWTITAPTEGKGEDDPEPDDDTPDVLRRSVSDTRNTRKTRIEGDSAGVAGDAGMKYGPSQVDEPADDQNRLGTLLAEAEGPEGPDAHAEQGPSTPSAPSGHAESEPQPAVPLRMCQACMAAADPADPAGLCGADDRNHRDVRRVLGRTA